MPFKLIRHNGNHSLYCHFSGITKTLYVECDGKKIVYGNNNPSIRNIQCPRCGRRNIF